MDVRRVGVHGARYASYREDFDGKRVSKMRVKRDVRDTHGAVEEERVD